MIRAIFLLSLFYSFFLYSAYLKSVKSPRSAALGSEIAGNIGLNETLRENPAAMAYSKDYTVEGMFTNSARYNTTILDISVIDSRTSQVAGGFAFSKINAPDNNDYNVFYGAIAERYWSNLAIALAGKYVMKKEGDEKKNFYDIDFGTLAAFNKYFGMGFVWKNVRATDKTVAPGEFVLGFQAAISSFFPTFNIVKPAGDKFQNFSRLKYAMGLEIVSKRKFFARLGYNLDRETKSRDMSIGCGWRAPRINFDYAFKRDVDNEMLYEHLASIRLHF